jgi:excisionase family DNA binding protein
MSVDLLLAPLPQLLEVDQVAHRIGFSPEFVRKLIRRGQLPAVRFGRCWRIEAADVRALVEAQRIEAQRTAVAREERAIDRRFAASGERLGEVRRAIDPAVKAIV